NLRSEVANGEVAISATDQGIKLIHSSSLTPTSTSFFVPFLQLLKFYSMHRHDWCRSHEKAPPPGQAFFEDPELDEEMRQMIVEERRQKHRRACKKYYDKHREKLLEKAAACCAKETHRLDNMNDQNREEALAFIRHDQREYQREWRKRNRSKLAAKARARRRG
ncbi:hypothetical protein FISHEDRAFT_59789, partial [Fistulina hepatica ATCC 64428]